MNYKINYIKKACAFRNIEFEEFMNDLNIEYSKFICGENLDEIYLENWDKTLISRKLNTIVPYFYGIIDDKHLFKNNLTLEEFNKSKRLFKIEEYLKNIGMDDYTHNIFDPLCDNYLSECYLNELVRYTYQNFRNLSRSEEYKCHYVKKNPLYIKDMSNPSEIVCISAVSSCGEMIKYVENQTEEMAYKAVCQNGDSLQHINPSLHSERVVKKALNTSPLSFKYSALHTYDICLEAVKANGNNLEFVPYELRDNNLIMTALSSNGWAIKFVDEQTEEFALAAVLQNTESCLYVDEKIRENNICIKSIYNEIIKRLEFLNV